MAKVSDSDLDAMFEEWDEATYTPTSGSAKTIYGVLQVDYAEVNGVEGVSPVFICTASGVSGVTHGATLTVDSTTYTIKGAQQEGNGVTRLVLEEQ